ncbi:MAG: MerR family transcriptional regulator [Alphaproteobacteria bacterium]
MLTIGAVARQTGLKIPTIRFYEAEGLLPAPPRSGSRRRLYGDRHVRRLAFIRHARQLGFELPQIRDLLELSEHPERPCGQADTIAEANLRAVQDRLKQLRALERELKRMVSACATGQAERCRIIEVLSDHGLCKVDAPCHKA